MTVCIITLLVRLNENEITLCRKGKNRGLNNLRTLLPVFQYLGRGKSRANMDCFDVAVTKVNRRYRNRNMVLLYIKLRRE